MTNTTKVINKYAMVGELLKYWNGSVYKTQYGQIGSGEKPTWTVKNVTSNGESDWVECYRNKADGTPGKITRYFDVTKDGSVKPAESKW